jgi:ribose transport system permease protein
VSAETATPERDTVVAGEPDGGDTARRGRGLGRALSMRNIGAVYVWLGVVVLFSLVAPTEFPTAQTAMSVVNQYAVTGIVALSLIIPLAAGCFDLSIGYIVSFSGVLVATLLNLGFGAVGSIVVTLVACAVFGALNWVVVYGLKVNSFIGTLASGTILGAVVIAITNAQPVTGEIAGEFSDISLADVGGITLPGFYMLALLLALAYWLERTQSGRFIYATGYDPETARLTGLPVGKITLVAFLTSAVIAGFAGIVLAARISAGSPEVGPPYLIPAFSAAFLGATQFRSGRFNPWGVAVAVLLLGTGDVGLLLSGGPVWAPQLFEGVVLIAAVALGGPGREMVKARWRTLRSRGTVSAANRKESAEGAP